MAKVALRPARAGDLEAIDGSHLACRVKGITAELDGRPIGMGGLVMRPDGTVWASLALAEGARRYKVTLHKAALMLLAEARAMGIRRVLAKAEKGRARAAEWLARLGFERHDEAGEAVWLWRPGSMSGQRSR